MAIVSLRWNGETLATRAVRSGEGAALGDVEGSLARVPEAALGAAALEVADMREGPHVCVPEGRVAKLTSASGGLRLVAGPARVALAAGDEASLVFGAFEVVVEGHLRSPVKEPRKVAAGAWAHTAVVAAVHAALLFAGSRAALASQIEAEQGPDVGALRGYLAASEQRSAAADAVLFSESGAGDTRKSAGRNGNGKEGGGERHEGDAGKAGSSAGRAKGRHWSAEGKPTKGTAVSEADSLEAARDFGMAGLLRAANSAAVPPIDGASPWGTDDPITAFGGMSSRVAGESEGVAGLSLSGIGEGGGGRGDGIGLGSIGTIGHIDGRPGLGTGGLGSPSQGGGSGVAWIGGWRSHIARPPTVRIGWGHGWIGRLPAEIIQRIVRQNFGRFRGCFEQGLKRNPELAGRVTARFVIGVDGSVMNAADGGSDMPDATVTSCVLRSFYGISFPQPEGGIVTVTYPIVFSKIDPAGPPAKPMSLPIP